MADGSLKSPTCPAYWLYGQTRADAIAKAKALVSTASACRPIGAWREYPRSCGHVPGRSMSQCQPHSALDSVSAIAKFRQ